MTIVRFGIYFATTGVAVPLVFVVVHVLLDRYHLSASGVADFVQGLQLFLWPSSIFMMATAGHGLTDWVTVKMFAFSVTVNVALYLFVGVSIWVGVNKDARWLLYAVPGGLVWGWYKLLQLGEGYYREYWFLYMIILGGIAWGYYKLVKLLMGSVL